MIVPTANKYLVCEEICISCEVSLMFTLNKICLEAYLAKEMRQEQNSLEIFYTCLAGYDIMPEPFSTPLAHAPVLNSCNKFESNGGRSPVGISPGLLLEQINELNLPTTSIISNLLPKSGYISANLYRLKFQFHKLKKTAKIVILTNFLIRLCRPNMKCS